MPENDTTELRKAFLVVLNTGDWCTKEDIRYAASEARKALDEWKHYDMSLYLDAKQIEETKINRKADLLSMSERLKLNLYKMILSLENSNY